MHESTTHRPAPDWLSRPAFLEVYHAATVGLVPLLGDRLTIGRAPANELVIASEEASRVHAMLERLAGGWTIRDLGSTNGTTVNAAPLRDCRVLRDGDEVRIAGARLVFRGEGGAADVRTAQAIAAPQPPPITRREQDVLAALCRPFIEGDDLVAECPSVRRLAAEVSLSESAVKKHLANLYDKFGLHTGEQRRRTSLASEALRRGALAAEH